MTLTDALNRAIAAELRLLNAMNLAGLHGSPEAEATSRRIDALLRMAGYDDDDDT